MKKNAFFDFPSPSQPRHARGVHRCRLLPWGAFPQRRGSGGADCLHHHWSAPLFFMFFNYIFFIHILIIIIFSFLSWLSDPIQKAFRWNKAQPKWKLMAIYLKIAIRCQLIFYVEKITSRTNLCFLCSIIYVYIIYILYILKYICIYVPYFL